MRIQENSCIGVSSSLPVGLMFSWSPASRHHARCLSFPFYSLRLMEGHFIELGIFVIAAFSCSLPFLNY